MRRRLIAAIALALFWMGAFAGPARGENLWEKLFGCRGVLPISCPGPVP